MLDLSSEFLFFLLKLFLIYCIGGLTLFFVIQQITKNQLPLSIQLLAGIGLSPYIVSLILYYLLIFFCQKSELFYLAVLFCFFSFLVVVFNRKILNFFKNLFIHQYKSKFFILLFSFIFIIGTIIIGNYIQKKPFIDHDMLEYAVQGKIFSEQKCIKYQKHNYHTPSGFYFVSLHGYSAPLLKTFEIFSNKILPSKDLLFRSLNIIFGFLFLILFFTIISHFTSSTFALIASVALFLNYGFIVILSQFHIDTYRLFFFSLSLYLMYNFLINSTSNISFLWGSILGAQSNIHSIGFILALMQIVITFFFLKKPIKQRILLTSSTSLFTFLFGAIHYVLDILLGTGWIFNFIKFF